MRITWCRGRWDSLAFLLVALALARGLTYGLLTPPWQAPDEPQHYQAVKLMMDLRQLTPTQDGWSATTIPSEVYRSLQESHFWELRYRRPSPVAQDPQTASETLERENMTGAVSHPPLYYVLGALWLAPLRSTTIWTQLYALRLLSVLASVVSVWVVYRAGRWLSPEDDFRRLSAGLFVVFLPMHSFMGATASNDAMVEMWASMMFLFLFWIGYYGLSTGRAVALLAALCLALLTKRTSLFLIPVALVGVLSCPDVFHWWARRFPCLKVRWGLWLLLSVVMGCALLIVLVACSGRLGISWWDAADRLQQLTERITSRGLDQYVLHTLLGFASFWANFGWMNIPLDIGWYIILAFISLGAGLGWLKMLLRSCRKQDGNPSVRWMWAVCGISLLLLAAQMSVSMIARDRPPQGRYLFPGMVPIALCLIWGVFEWFPERYRAPVFWGLVVWWVFFDGAALFGYMLPYFYAGRM